MNENTDREDDMSTFKITQYSFLCLTSVIFIVSYLFIVGLHFALSIPVVKDPVIPSDFTINIEMKMIIVCAIFHVLLCYYLHNLMKINLTTEQLLYKYVKSFRKKSGTILMILYIPGFFIFYFSYEILSYYLLPIIVFIIIIFVIILGWIRKDNDEYNVDWFWGLPENVDQAENGINGVKKIQKDSYNNKLKSNG